MLPKARRRKHNDILSGLKHFQGLIEKLLGSNIEKFPFHE
jgi:hypothetical protein